MTIKQTTESSITLEGGKREMDKPCEHCDKADKSKSDYFKCDTPCNRAKQCYENDRKLLEILRGNPLHSK